MSFEIRFKCRVVLSLSSFNNTVWQHVDWKSDGLILNRKGDILFVCFLFCFVPMYIVCVYWVRDLSSSECFTYHSVLYSLYVYIYLLNDHYRHGIVFGVIDYVVLQIFHLYFKVFVFVFFFFNNVMFNTWK